MTTTYDIRKIKSELQALGKKLKPHEKALIASLEQCSTVTVNTYLDGKMAVPALADAILKRAKAIIKNRY